MGVEDTLPNEQPPDSLTLGELRNIYGKEVVARGIAYMESLEDADRSYRGSADDETFKREMKDAFDVEEMPDEAEESINRWKKSMESTGLKIRDE